MSDRPLSPAIAEKGHSRQRRTIYWWLAAPLVLATLAGCEHGTLSFDQSTGQFNLPIGAGSHQGTSR